MRKEDRMLGVTVLIAMVCIFASIILYNVVVIRERKSDLSSLKGTKTITTVGFVYRVSRAGKGLNNNSYPSFIAGGDRINGDIPFVSKNPLPINAPIAVRYFEENPHFYKIVKDTILYFSDHKFEYMTIKKKKGVWAGDYKCNITRVE